MAERGMWSVDKLERHVRIVRFVVGELFYKSVTACVVNHRARVASMCGVNLSREGGAFVVVHRKTLTITKFKA